MSFATLTLGQWGQGELSEPMPRRIKLAWAVFLTGLVIYPLQRFGIRSKRSKRNGSRPTNGTAAAHAKAH